MQTPVFLEHWEHDPVVPYHYGKDLWWVMNRFCPIVIWREYRGNNSCCWTRRYYQDIVQFLRIFVTPNVPYQPRVPVGVTIVFGDFITTS